MNNPIFEPRHNEYGRHVTSGILNSGIVQTVKVLCQFASVVVLSRLLLPSDFGLVAMASPVVGFLALFQDLGLNQATVQKSNLNHSEVNAFFWINVFGGLALTFLLFGISPIVGWYYNEPRAGYLTAAIGLLVFISGLGNQHSAILQRRMEFGTLGITGACGALTGLLAAVIWAIMFRNYWAIYVGMVVGTIIPVAGVWIASGWRPTSPQRVVGLSAMLKFGAGITSSNVSTFIARNIDNLLIGRVWGEKELGLYDRAYKLLLFPIQRIIDPMSGVMIPVLSRLTNEPDRYKSIFLRSLSQLILVTWPGIICAIIFANTVIPTLLGKNWASASPMFVPLALAGLLQVGNGLTSWLFVSQGRTGEFARWSVINAATCVASFLIGLPHGAAGVAIAYAVGEYLRTPVLWWYVTRNGPVFLRDILNVIFPHIVSASVICFVLFITKTIGLDERPWFVLICISFVAYFTYAATMALFPGGRETLRQSFGVAKRLVIHILPKLGGNNLEKDD